MFIVKAGKLFHSGNLEGIMVDWQCSYPTLDSAVEAMGFLIAYSGNNQFVDLGNVAVSYHCIRMEYVDKHEVGR